MQLNLEIKNVTEWKAILSAISNLSDEAMFLCNDDGITFRGMDKSHLAYLSVNFLVHHLKFMNLKHHFLFYQLKNSKTSLILQIMNRL